MTHGNSGIQPDSNRHKPGKKQAAKQVQNLHLTLGLTHEMTHNSGRRIVAGMSVPKAITEDQAKIYSSQICSLFHAFATQWKDGRSIMAEPSAVALKLFLYFMTFKTGAI